MYGYPPFNGGAAAGFPVEPMSPHNGRISNWNTAELPHNGGGNSGISSWSGAVPLREGGASNWNGAVPPHNGGGSNWNGEPPPQNGGAVPPHEGGVSSWSRAVPPHDGRGSNWNGAPPPHNGGGINWNGAELPHNGGISIWNGAAPPVGYHSPNFSIQRPNFLRFSVQPNPNTQFQRPQPPKGSSNLSEIVQKVDKAAKKARRDLIDAATFSDLMKNLKKIPLIPLSDGNYGSLDEGAIWLQFNSMGATIDGDYAPETFPRLPTSLRTVSPALLSAASALGTSNGESAVVDNVIKMLYRADVQPLLTHQIVKKHILPSIYSENYGEGYRDLMTEYVAFLMFHLQSSCPNCQLEKEQIISEVRGSAFCQCDTCVCQCPELHNNSLYFAFLPLRKYGLKYKFQGDFVLPSSRDEANGDNAWNQWLLLEFPGLFVSTERSFCNMPCFRDNPAKGVAVYMSFVPLVGEGHGFFSCLPQMILSRLRMSNFLIVEGAGTEWVAPSKVLRNWTEESRKLLPDSLLRYHLGVGFLHKDIVLPDLLARSLGVEEYGLKVLFQVITSVCSSEDGIKSMGLGWLSSWLNNVYTLLTNGQDLAGFGTELDLMKDLKKIPFIALSDVKYGSLDEGPIWLHFDSTGAAIDGDYAPKTFPRLHACLRTVSSALLSAAAALGTSCCGSSVVENVSMMRYRVGVHQLSAHQIVKIHILPYLYRDKNVQGHKEIMTEYLAFFLFHFQSNCCDCQSEKEQIIRELRDNVFILTNHGCRRPIEVPIHFSKEYGNPIDMSRLIQGLDLTWHEIDDMYLKHPINRMLSGGVLKWRKFFQEMGISDFVQVLEVEKSMSDVCPLPMNVTGDKDLMPIGSIAKDWVSEEFVNMLLQLSSTRDKEKCKYLLEVLDRLWDDYFSGKASVFYFTSDGERKIFDSSFRRILCDVRWIASTLDNELHCTRELFHDCEAVRSIFGDNAPYTVPKVRSERLLTALGLKTQVTADDTLAILKVWRAKAPFRASVSQMSRFYTFVWNRMNTSERKVVEELHDGPSVFVPSEFGVSLEDVVPGVLLSLKEVFWCDSTGSVDQVKMVSTKFVQHTVQQHPVARILCNLYPGLHDFFVNRCGVDEFPHFHGYVLILLHLSAVALPSQIAKQVFRIFLKWCLKEKQHLILPTTENKWVSLNQSFGFICWCDDDKLRTEFEHFDNINFLYFGELNDEEKEILRTKVSIFMRRLNIPSLLRIVVTREIIYDGPTDACFIASMVNWSLPYAQQYIYSMNTDKYLQLSQSVFENLRCLEIVVVEKLFYRNLIKSVRIESEKQCECNCLLEGNVLYVTQESDFHSIVMEISRLFCSRDRHLHMANFLHMITTIAKSGSSEEQIEFFILNSQKMPKLPVGESVWSLANIPLSTDSVTWLMTICASRTIGETNTLNFKKKPGGSSNCVPGETDHAVHDSRAIVMKTQAASSIQPRKEETVEEVIEETPAQAPTQITCVRNDSVAPLDCKTNHHLHDSQAIADKTLAAGGILSRKEERIEEVIAETSVLAPTEITCRLNHPAPSADWKTDHGFRGSCGSVMKMQAASYIQPRREETVEVVEETSALVPTQVTCVRNDPVPTNGKTDHGFYGSNASVMKTQTPSRNNPASAASLLGSRDTDHICNVLVPSTVNTVHSSPYNATAQQHLNYSSVDMKETGQPSVGMGYPQQTLTDRFSDHVHNMLMPFTVNAAVNIVPALQDLSYNSFDARERVQLSFGTVDPQQALSTGRLGKSAAYNYFVGIFGEHFVKWVNETNETGLPYDLVVAGNEYIEVKATRSVTKDWFHITLREWQFALEKGNFLALHMLYYHLIMQQK
ncbi:protein NO VEIN-like isoform X2 [Capsicum chacoense]